MTVAQLIAALQALPSGSQVLLDLPLTNQTVTERWIQGTLVAPTIVAGGLTFKLYEQNSGMGLWVDTDPNFYVDLNEPNKPGTPSVYIGTGNGITEVKWDVTYPSGV